MFPYRLPGAVRKLAGGVFQGELSRVRLLWVLSRAPQPTVAYWPPVSCADSSHHPLIGWQLQELQMQGIYTDEMIRY